ncbi:MAG TPA: NAD(+) synthase [Desulfotomaculum sp.]|nr:NAD(+) synthase [Desulfotomaculum sp.]
MSARLCSWLQDELVMRNSRGYVFGLSGGIDSAVVAALCKSACGQNVLGLIMPCHSDHQDEKDAELIADSFSVKTKTIILDNIFDLMVTNLTGEEYHPGNKDTAISNIKPRLRMITLYFFAARNQYLVAGTGNRSELTVGYFTKHGDGGADLLPIGKLVKSQVCELAEYLGVPKSIIKKPPSAGLWKGQTDESEMGITYQELDEFILTGNADDRVKDVINNLVNRSAHKRSLPVLPPF